MENSEVDENFAPDEPLPKMLRDEQHTGELLPCPFCKKTTSEVIEYTGFVYNPATGDGHHGQSHGFVIKCGSCPAQVGYRTSDEWGEDWGSFTTRESAVAAWNTRTQPRVPVETPWTCAGHGDNFNDGCTECEWVATCNRYEEHIAKLEAQPRVTVEEVALWLYNRYEPHPVGWQNQTEMVRQAYLSDAQALKAAHPHLFKE